MEDTQFNKPEVIIIGAGGLAREINSWITISKSKEINVVGFMDDNLTALDKFEMEKRVFSKIDLSKINKSQGILFGITDCSFKSKLFEKAKSTAVKVLSYFHESVLIGERTILGKGLVICPNAIISCDSIIGNLVFINIGSQIGHDVIIGDFTSIMANVDIGGGAVIGNNVFIGSNAVILPGVKIPDGTRIGAGAVVLRSIKQSGTYFGNPAKKIF